MDHPDLFLNAGVRWQQEMRWQMQEIVPGYFVGPYRCALAQQKDALLEKGITHIVCIRTTQEEKLIVPQCPDTFNYLVLDAGYSGSENIIPLIPRFLEFVQGVRASGGRILVHDSVSISLALALTVVFLMVEYGLFYRDAMEVVQHSRRCVSISPQMSLQIKSYLHMRAAQAAVSASPRNSNRTRMPGVGELEGLGRRQWRGDRDDDDDDDDAGDGAGDDNGGEGGQMDDDDDDGGGDGGGDGGDGGGDISSGESGEGVADGFVKQHGAAPSTGRSLNNTFSIEDPLTASLSPSPSSTFSTSLLQRRKTSKAQRLVLVAAVLAGLGGFLFGYDVGVISGALLQLEEKFDLTDVQKELVVSLMLLGAMIASMAGGHIVDYFGRRNAIIGNSVIFLVGAVFMTLAPNLAVLLIGRIVVGFAVSLSATSEVIYISEIAPAEKRGMLVSVNEMGITIGIFVSYLVNYAFISTSDGWRYMFGLSMVPAVIQGIGMLFLPKSPRWLLLRKQPLAARASLALLRNPNTSNIEAEMHAIESSLKAQDSQSLLSLLTDRRLRRCLLIACGLALLQQFTGQPNVLYYGSTLFKAAGFDTDREATLANLVIGGVKVIATAIALVKVDSLGRRPLLLAGTALMIVSLVVLASVTTAFPPVRANNSTMPNTTTTTTTTTTIAPTTVTQLPTTTTTTMPAGNTSTTAVRAPSSAPQHRDRRAVTAWAYTTPAPPTMEHGAHASISPAPASLSSWWQAAVADPSEGSSNASPAHGTTHLRGRRRAHVSSSHHKQDDWVFSSAAVKWTSLVSMIFFVVAYAFSYGPVSWLVMSEIFPDDLRGRAVSIATIFNWGGNLIVSLSFLSLLDTVGFAGTFFMYAVIGVVAFVFVLVLVPETRGRSLEDIAEIMKTQSNHCLDLPCIPKRKGYRLQQDA